MLSLRLLRQTELSVLISELVPTCAVVLGQANERREGGISNSNIRFEKAEDFRHSN